MLILYGRAIEETLITSTAYKSIELKKIKYKNSLHRDDRLGSFKRIKYEVLALQSGVSMQYRSFKLFTEKDRPSRNQALDANAKDTHRLVCKKLLDQIHNCLASS